MRNGYLLTLNPVRRLTGTVRPTSFGSEALCEAGGMGLRHVRRSRIRIGVPCRGASHLRQGYGGQVGERRLTRVSPFVPFALFDAKNNFARAT